MTDSARVWKVSLGSGLLLLAALGAVSVMPPVTRPAVAQSTPQQCRDGQSRALEVRNLSRRSLQFLRIRSAYSREAWGTDLLGDHVTVPSGQTVVLSMPAQTCSCQVDIQATFAAQDGDDGAPEWYEAINYCYYSNDSYPLLIVGN